MNLRWKIAITSIELYDHNVSFPQQCFLLFMSTQFSHLYTTVLEVVLQRLGGFSGYTTMGHVTVQTKRYQKKLTLPTSSVITKRCTYYNRTWYQLILSATKTRTTHSEITLNYEPTTWVESLSSFHQNLNVSNIFLSVFLRCIHDDTRPSQHADHTTSMTFNKQLFSLSIWSIQRPHFIVIQLHMPCRVEN